jgi:tetratricopeptide (TPR) repeat protein
MTDPVQPNTDHQDDTSRLDAHLQNMADEQFRRQMRQATILLSNGKGKEAIPLLERCTQLRPEDVDVLTNLGGAYILAGQYRRAVPVLEKASDLAPDNPAVWANLAAALLGKLVTATGERQMRALAAYERVIEIDPAYPNVHYHMGLIYVDRRDWEAAYDAFTRAIKHNPHDRDAYRMRQRVIWARSQPPNPSQN